MLCFGATELRGRTAWKTDTRWALWAWCPCCCSSRPLGWAPLLARSSPEQLETPADKKETERNQSFSTCGSYSATSINGCKWRVSFQQPETKTSLRYRQFTINHLYFTSMMNMLQHPSGCRLTFLLAGSRRSHFGTLCKLSLNLSRNFLRIRQSYWFNNFLSKPFKDLWTFDMWDIWKLKTVLHPRWWWWRILFDIRTQTSGWRSK